MEKEVIIKLTDVSKSYDGETVLDHINLQIHDKEFVTLLGPSGCGKTTTLRIIGGFESPDTGDVAFDGKSVKDTQTLSSKSTRFSPISTSMNTSPSVSVSKRHPRQPSAKRSRICSLSSTSKALNAAR